MRLLLASSDSLGRLSSSLTFLKFLSGSFDASCPLPRRLSEREFSFLSAFAWRSFERVRLDFRLSLSLDGEPPRPRPVLFFAGLGFFRFDFVFS